MKSYEGIFIFPPESAPDARKAQMKNWDDLFHKFGAEVTQKNEWGRKPLGYPLRKFREGHILVADFKMDPAKAIEFRKSLELFEDLLKFMITVKDEKKIAKAAAAAASKAAAAKPAPAPASTPAAS